MGTFRYPVEIGDPQGQRFERVEALVDTGASYTVLPASLLRRMGVEPYERRSFRLADERRLEMDIGVTQLRIDGRTMPTVVVFGDENVEPLLGAYALEGFGLAVDPLGRRLVPTPGLLMQIESYSAASRELLAKAQEALAQGDLVQASKKGWGAAAQMVKAVAERRGWPHNGHRLLFEAVGRLAQETGERRITELFHAANSLHGNFYESWLTPEQVEVGLEQVRELLDRLEPLLR